MVCDPYCISTLASSAINVDEDAVSAVPAIYWLLEVVFESCGVDEVPLKDQVCVRAWISAERSLN